MLTTLLHSAHLQRSWSRSPQFRHSSSGILFQNTFGNSEYKEAVEFIHHKAKYRELPLAKATGPRWFRNTTVEAATTAIRHDQRLGNLHSEISARRGPQKGKGSCCKRYLS